MSTTQKPITSLADLTKLTKATISGGLGSKEYFYKADEVEALVAHLTPAPLADAELAELGRDGIELAIKVLHKRASFEASICRPYINILIRAAATLPGLLARLAAAEAKATSLQAFKDFVHTTLDNAGVDKHEEQNATTGCRVGARLADLIAVKGGQQSV